MRKIILVLLATLMMTGMAYGWSFELSTGVAPSTTGVTNDFSGRGPASIGSNYYSGGGSTYGSSSSGAFMGSNFDGSMSTYAGSTAGNGSASVSASSTVIGTPCEDNNENGVCDDEEIEEARCFVFEGTINNTVNSMGPAWASSTLFYEAGMFIGTDVSVEVCTDEGQEVDTGDFYAALADAHLVGGHGLINGDDPYDYGIWSESNDLWLILVGVRDEFVQLNASKIPSEWELGDTVDITHSAYQQTRGILWYSRIMFTGTITEITIW